MGKKGKVGKQRRDKYYGLAKDIGYRSRAAFKLLQLNQKFHFLEKSKVVVDLCAAPGSWLQVAREKMPVQSILLGVDLCTIRSITNVITTRSDITTDQCASWIRQQLSNWKVDTFLHDGAPNVSGTWAHDAFEQNVLVVKACQLACTHLRPGGWFITKVFRSKDFNALIWLLNQLFGKVNVTKPQASRMESAEIFVVCQSFKAPAKIDPRFFDIKTLFKDTEDENKNHADVLKIAGAKKVKRNREGYADDTPSHMYKEISAHTFVTAGSNYVQMLGNTNCVKIDDEVIKNHPFTTNEIVEICKDIKVCGKGELKQLLLWRKKMAGVLAKAAAKEKPKKETPSTTEEPKEDTTVDQTEADEEAAIMKELAAADKEHKKILKKKLRKLRRKRIEVSKKIQQKIIQPHDEIIGNNDQELFSLKNIKRIQDAHDEVAPEVVIESQFARKPCPVAEETFIPLGSKRMAVFSDQNRPTYSSDESEPDERTERKREKKSGFDDAERQLDTKSTAKSKGSKKSELLHDVETKNEKVERLKAMWFEKDSFKEVGFGDVHAAEAAVSSGDDDDLEWENSDFQGDSDYDDNIDKAASVAFQARLDARKKAEAAQAEKFGDENEKDTKWDDEEGDGEEEQPWVSTGVTFTKTVAMPEQRADSDSENEEVPDPEVLAIGQKLINSRKDRSHVIDAMFHRYTGYGNETDNLPDWFRDDESRHCKPVIPVTKDQVNEMRERMKALDARPIKKVAQAKARKKKRKVKQLEAARKKSEAIYADDSVPDAEKLTSIKTIYKAAVKRSKAPTKTSLVVSKKGGKSDGGKKAGQGTKIKRVDARMKKEVRASRVKDMMKKNKKKAKTVPNVGKKGHGGVRHRRR